jgi:hypothetical protein
MKPKVKITSPSRDDEFASSASITVNFKVPAATNPGAVSVFAMDYYADQHISFERGGPRRPIALGSYHEQPAGAKLVNLVPGAGTFSVTIPGPRRPGFHIIRLVARDATTVPNIDPVNDVSISLPVRIRVLPA